MAPVPQVVLTIAGSDPSGGAGLQADLRAIAVHGQLGAAVVTALTVQNSRGVMHVHPVDSGLVAAQIAAVLDDMPVAAIKIGMLGNAEVAGAVADAVSGTSVPVVLDPVITSTSGAALLSDAALHVVRDRLAPLATLVTPNLAEARALLDGDEPDAARLADLLGVPVLLTGGHAAGDLVTDVLDFPGEGRTREFSAPRIPTPHDHGTGCLLSTSIACSLAAENSVVEAVEHGRRCVRAGLVAARGLGAGPGAVLLLDLPRGDGF
ncbi:MAG: bifunctional hydroxymethylpyrimidine kinase/phosphomethylpyrimidine kinase [Deltaproteobacteria bacterium]|nr:bifunctional hydroxymethylpyrimidine kinase/phosphomethylpyrimidine kinase [Deltaproteobacteria bacterium]